MRERTLIIFLFLCHLGCVRALYTEVNDTSAGGEIALQRRQLPNYCFNGVQNYGFEDSSNSNNYWQLSASSPASISFAVLANNPQGACSYAGQGFLLVDSNVTTPSSQGLVFSATGTATICNEVMPTFGFWVEFYQFATPDPNWTCTVQACVSEQCANHTLINPVTALNTSPAYQYYQFQTNQTYDMGSATLFRVFADGQGVRCNASSLHFDNFWIA